MNLTFWKMNGAGNDFVCVDNRNRKLRLTRKLVAKLCTRQPGIGSDGLLALEPANAKGADFRMRYYNSDGGEAEMCGNGARCFARFAKERANWKKPVIHFSTKAGLIRAEFIGKNVRIQLTPPSAPVLNQKIKTEHGGNLTVHSINTGVPHAVVFVKDLEKVPVHHLGHELRFHKTFAPKGTNVNFVQVLGSGKIRVRTYERGVEAETLACGTGVTASALISHLVQKFKSPVRVRVQSGEDLGVAFDKNGGNFENVTLLGPATMTFKGEINV